MIPLWAHDLAHTGMLACALWVIWFDGKLPKLPWKRNKLG